MATSIDDALAWARSLPEHEHDYSNGPVCAVCDEPRAMSAQGVRMVQWREERGIPMTPIEQRKIPKRPRKSKHVGKKR